MDAINPEHYKKGGIECVEAIKASMSDLEFQGYLKGNVLKYMWRFRHKKGVEDLQKAEWYNKRLIDELKANPV
jgi:hypothetical protein